MPNDNFKINNFDPLHHVDGLTKLNSSIERNKNKKEKKHKKKHEKEKKHSTYFHNTENDEIELVEPNDMPDDEDEHIDFRA